MQRGYFDEVKPDNIMASGRRVTRYLTRVLSLQNLALSHRPSGKPSGNEASPLGGIQQVYLDLFRRADGVE